MEVNRGGGEEEGEESEEGMREVMKLVRVKNVLIGLFFFFQAEDGIRDVRT